MRWLILIIGPLLLLGLVMYVVGSFLPVKHIAKVKRSFRLRPDQLWQILVDFREYITWRSDLKSLHPISDRKWKEESRHGVITYEQEINEPARSFTNKIISEDLPFGGYWHFEIAETAEGSEVSITEYGEVYNPMFRFMSKFLFGHDSTLNKYVEDLERTQKQL
jgi:hypothetical protein